MNKEKLFTIFSFLFIQFNLLAVEPYDAREYLEYTSFGYNAVETTHTQGDKSIDFYMLNNPLYSNMKIWDFDYGQDSASPLSPILGTERYHLMEGYTENGHPFLREWPLTEGLNHYYDRYKGGFTGPEGAGFMYTTDRTKRMITAWYVSRYRESETAAKSIRYNPVGSVTVDFGDGFTKRFYNIPKQELIDMYLAAFTQTARRYLNRLVDETLQGRTKEELAIIRNCIFAKYNYAFQTPKWRQFMLSYYDTNYEGRYTNQEVMDMLSDNEKRLLEKIIEYENR
jgi:hypothetical protein